jgi:hypothetical protein
MGIDKSGKHRLIRGVYRFGGLIFPFYFAGIPHREDSVPCHRNGRVVQYPPFPVHGNDTSVGNQKIRFLHARSSAFRISGVESRWQFVALQRKPQQTEGLREPRQSEFFAYLCKKSTGATGSQGTFKNPGWPSKVPVNNFLQQPVSP